LQEAVLAGSHVRKHWPASALALCETTLYITITLAAYRSGRVCP